MKNITITRRPAALAALFGAALLPAAAIAANGAGAGPGPRGYTNAQAALGKTQYDANCASCHMSNLAGGAGPALAGTRFESYLTLSHLTAPQLLSYISKQMPYNKPGSLKPAEYRNILAYILKYNHYPAGRHELTDATVAQVKLLPYPTNTDGSGAETGKSPTPAKPGSTNGSGSETGGKTVAAKTAITAHVDVSTAMLTGAQHSKADWLLSGRDYDNSRFSPLKQITAHNVSQLAPVAIAQTGFTASFETTPIVVDGIMYLTTPMVDSKQALIAMNAVTGKTLWTYTYADGQNAICCGPVNRGAAIADGKVFFLTIDDHLIALDAKTGKQSWTARLADARYGYSETMAPTVYKNMVIVGSAGGEWPIRGFIAAYDIKTGKQVWRFHTTDRHGSWAGNSWKHGGGTVWETPTIDPKRGLVIFATGNPNPDLNGAGRAGKNLYTDSIVALHVATGKLAWYYQEVPHDVWDYDAISNVVLFDTMDHGKKVPAAGEAGKTAWFYIVNRNTGKLIRKSQPFDEQKNMFAQPTTAGVQMLPGANGGAEWSPPAYSPMTHNVYIMGMNQLMTFTNEKSSPALPGQIRLGSTFKNVKHGVQNGTLTAIDVNTGKITWNDKFPQPMMGGVLATAGNLVFTGEGNGKFDAVDAKTGKHLWSFNLGAGVNAPPIAYSVKGREYIAVAAGGNFQLSYPYGDTVAIFALPTRVAQGH